jgi:hypothetical protein
MELSLKDTYAKNQPRVSFLENGAGVRRENAAVVIACRNVISRLPDGKCDESC